MKPRKLSALTKMADGNPTSHIEKTVVRLPEDACARMLSDLGAPSMDESVLDDSDSDDEKEKGDNQTTWESRSRESQDDTHDGQTCHRFLHD